MPSVELIAIGTELLLGQLTDTNSRHVAGALAEVGIDVFATHAIGDNRARIAQAIRDALARADGVITTGGLGPTVDDVTKDAVCDVLGVGTETDVAALEAMERFFASLGRTMRENNRRQTDLPTGSIALRNPNGTAPGLLYFRSDGTFVACMPGVPSEMRPMLANELLPKLRERYTLRDRIVTRVVHCINIAESEIDHRIGDLFASLENPKIAVLAHGGQCDVKIMAKADSVEGAQGLIAPIQRDIEGRLRGHVYGTDATTLEAAIHEQLQASGRWCAAAESCTGGRVAALLTATPGSSRSFRGGIVAYDNDVKIRQLAVRPETLAEHGAVSEATVLEMARGALDAFDADVAVATTGIAGPDGGTPEKPVGLVWYAVAHRDGRSRAVSFTGRGGRTDIQQRSATFALGLLWNELKSPQTMIER